MLLQTISFSLCFISPQHPKDIVFPEYVFNPPIAETYLETLQNGVPVFIVEDGELPLIEVVATFKGGSYLDGSDQVGLTPNSLRSLPLVWVLGVGEQV